MSLVDRGGMEAARAVKKLGASQTVKQLGRNVATIARNGGESLMQDHSRMQNNSLILSSLILALSRVFVSNYSARKSKGTSDGPLRYREAIRTTIREVCGWTFGYVILRWMQNMVKLGMAHQFGIKDKYGKPVRFTPSYFMDKWKTTLRNSPTGQALKASINRDGYEVIRKSRRPIGEKVFEFANVARAEKFQKWVSKIIPKAAKLSTKEFMQVAYRWAPIVIGSIPSVVLAGYMLERFTRDHSDEVVATISKRFGGDAGGGQACDPANPTQACTPQINGAGPGFDSYRARIQQLQSERSGQ